MIAFLRHWLWTRPHTKFYAIRAARKEKQHRYPIGSLYNGEKILGREILVSDGDMYRSGTIVGLYLEKTTMVRKALPKEG